MNFQSEDYDLVSDTEIDQILTDLPMEVIQEQFRYQINNPLSTSVNLLDGVMERLVLLREEYAENEDAQANVKTLTINFFTFLIQELEQKFNITTNMDSFGAEEYVRVGSALYNFLILRYKKNVSKFLYKYIIDNKKTIVKEFDSNLKRKDVTSIAIKKKIKNKDDATILSCLPSIIKFIMGIEIDSTEFLQYVSNGKYYEANIIRQLYDTGDLVGNFVPNYFEILTNDYDYIFDVIQTEVRSKLLNKF